jgi:hypothetical protein
LPSAPPRPARTRRSPRPRALVVAQGEGGLAHRREERGVEAAVAVRLDRVAQGVHLEGPGHCRVVVLVEAFHGVQELRLVVKGVELVAAVLEEVPEFLSVHAFVSTCRVAAVRDGRNGLGDGGAAVVQEGLEVARVDQNAVAAGDADGGQGALLDQAADGGRAEVEGLGGAGQVEGAADDSGREDVCGLVLHKFSFGGA